MKPILIPVNPEHLIAYDMSRDNKRVEGERPCCQASRRLAWLICPMIGIVHMNVNYCPLCGRKLNNGLA